MVGDDHLNGLLRQFRRMLGHEAFAVVVRQQLFHVDPAGFGLSFKGDLQSLRVVLNAGPLALPIAPGPGHIKSRAVGKGLRGVARRSSVTHGKAHRAVDVVVAGFMLTLVLMLQGKVILRQRDHIRQRRRAKTQQERQTQQKCQHLFHEKSLL